MTLRQTSLVVIALLGSAMLVASFFVSTGFLLIDEVLYMLSADTFRDTGSLIFQNGYEAYGSSDQRWFDLLSVGPNGLAPQYPVEVQWWEAFLSGYLANMGFTS